MTENGIPVHLTIDEYTFLMGLRRVGKELPPDLPRDWIHFVIMGKEVVRANEMPGLYSFLGKKM